ncbi:MAG: hypothetical protein HY078_09395 [Elusimicrobia bacterium]|nr:hypothetical protein [Elusimicrobiota bacterium]
MKRLSLLAVFLVAVAAAALAAGPRKPPPHKGARKPKPTYESALREVEKRKDAYEGSKRDCGRAHSNLGSYTGAGGLKDEKKLHDLRTAKDHACGGNHAMEYIQALTKAIDLGEDEVKELQNEYNHASAEDKPHVKKELDSTRAHMASMSATRQSLRSMHTSNPHKR